jgi:hypothetical protein
MPVPVTGNCGHAIIGIRRFRAAFVSGLLQGSIHSHSTMT